MNATSCPARIDAIAAWVLGDLPAPEAAELREHLAACAGCRTHEAHLRATAEAVRTDLPAPSPALVRRVAAAARLAAPSGAPAPVAAEPSPGWVGLLGAAAAAAILIGLAIPRGAAPVTAPPPLPGDHRIGNVRPDGGGFVWIDDATGREDRFRPWPNASSEGMPGPGVLRVGTLEVAFPADYRGPGGAIAIAVPGGTVTVQARPGARYELTQAPGAGQIPAGLARNARELWSGDSGVVSLRAALEALAGPERWTVDVAPDAGAERVQTRLTLAGVTGGTALALLVADAREAGFAVTRRGNVLHVARDRDVAAPPPLAPAARREGDLYVDVRGTGEATVAPAGTDERITARGGAMVQLVGRTFGRFELPDHGAAAVVEQRVRVHGVGDGGQVALVSVDDAAPVPVAAGDDLLGYRVQHVGPGGVALARGRILLRVRVGGRP